MQYLRNVRLVVLGAALRSLAASPSATRGGRDLTLLLGLRVFLIGAIALVVRIRLADPFFSEVTVPLP